MRKSFYTWLMTAVSYTHLDVYKRQGIENTGLRYDDFDGKKMAFFFDPEGLPLEIHE